MQNHPDNGFSSGFFPPDNQNQEELALSIAAESGADGADQVFPTPGDEDGLKPADVYTDFNGVNDDNTAAARINRDIADLGGSDV